MDQFEIPQGFESAPVEQQRAYIRRLEAIVIGRQPAIPLSDDERAVIEKRLAEANAPDAVFYDADEMIAELRSR